MDKSDLIVCAVDFSSGSAAVVETASVMAKAMGASIELLHVYQLPVLALPDGVITAGPAFIATLTAGMQQRLEEYRDRLGVLRVRATTKIVEGNPAQTIVDYVDKVAASLLVLGTHGRSGFKRFLLGSTAERVVRLSRVPVLTVRVGAEEADVANAVHA